MFKQLWKGIQGIFGRDEVLTDTNKNISEPVISMVQTFLDNPKRFKYSSTYYPHCGSEYHYVTDTETGMAFSAFRDQYCRPQPKTNLEWMTREEFVYCYDTLMSYYKGRHNRLLDLKAIRAQRAKDRERQKYVDLYCK